MKRFFFLISVCLELAACGTKGVKPQEAGTASQHAQWETKAVVSDLKNNKSHSLDIDVLTDQGRLRMEISALMGVQVASLVLNADDIRYAIYPQKKFYQGRPTESSFLPLINVPLHPRNFLNLATDAPMRGQGWACVRGADRMISECNQAEKNLKVQWTDRTQEGQKKVLISGPGFEMRWLFRAPQTEVQFKNDTFILEPPPSFKTIQLK